MDTITLRRSGDAPLKFSGELLAEVGGETGVDTNRWHDLALYRAGQQYVAALHYRSRWDNESSYDAAGVCAGAGEVAAFFRAHDPLARFVGPPDGHPKRALIASQLRAQYESAVSDLLADLPEAPDEDYCWCDEAAHESFLRAALAELTLTRSEACALCDANNGAILFERPWLSLAANIWDTPAESLSTKWDCDAADLAQRVQAASLACRYALAVAVARFWRASERETDEVLREVGLLT